MHNLCLHSDIFFPRTEEEPSAGEEGIPATSVVGAEGAAHLISLFVLFAVRMSIDELRRPTNPTCLIYLRNSSKL